MSTDLPRNHLIIQILGEDAPDEDAMFTSEDSSFSSESGEWTGRLMVSAAIEFLNLSCMSLTGGITLRDIPENSRLKALDDCLEQAKRLLDSANETLRLELLNPDAAGIVTDIVSDESSIDDSDEPYRLPTPEDLQP